MKTTERPIVNRIYTDRAAILREGDAEGLAERSKALRYRLALADGTSYVATNVFDIGKSVLFELQVSPYINSGSVGVEILSSDIESGAVRVDVYV